VKIKRKRRNLVLDQPQKGKKGETPSLRGVSFLFLFCGFLIQENDVVKVVPRSPLTAKGVTPLIYKFFFFLSGAQCTDCHFAPRKKNELVRFVLCLSSLMARNQRLITA
jgi:hypothetical protein